MDPGFVSVDDASLSLSGNDQIFFIRIPKDMNMELLNGLEVDLESEKEISRIQPDGQPYEYTISHDRSNTSDIFRPIVSNSITSSASIGSKFDGVLQIVQSFKVPTLADKDKKNLSRAYCPVEQVDFLQVRTLPRGSLSTLNEVHARQRQSDKEFECVKLKRSADENIVGGVVVETKKHKKSRKSLDLPNPSITTTEAVEEKGTDKKKKKKKDKN